jgi:hypothetical protein
MDERFRVLSWGMGQQSTTLAVMSALGDLERLDAVLAADPGWERRATYETTAFYVGWLRDRGLYVEVIKTGDIRVEGATEHRHVPFWTADGGPMKRQCTRHFKIRPVRRRVRELMGYDASVPPNPPAGSVEQWIGYSWDESERWKVSDVAFIVNRAPLIDMRMTRDHCVAYLESKGLPVPVKSACVACPFRGAGEYLDMPGDEFAEAVAFDEENRCNPFGGTADELFVYKSPRGRLPTPLGEADLEADLAYQERGGRQLGLDMCDGPCMT